MFNGNDCGNTAQVRKTQRTSSKNLASPQVRTSKPHQAKRTFEGRSNNSQEILIDLGSLTASFCTGPSLLKKSETAIEAETRASAALSSALSAFARDAAEVPLLTQEQEVELARRIEKGDLAAREHMIRANLRLVMKIARDYENLGLPLMDLISEGTIGLMKAVDRFDPRKGGKLSTYGSWWIKQQIRRALANQARTIRLPVHVEAKLYRLGKAEARLHELLGREATDEELGGELNMNARRVGRLRRASVRPASLDAPIGEDDQATLSELVGDQRGTTPSEDYERENDHGLLRKLIDFLPEREAKILRLRFGLNGGEEQTLEELGRQFGLTRERIRQLQNEAFRKLRAMMENPPAALHKQAA